MVDEGDVESARDKLGANRPRSSSVCSVGSVMSAGSSENPSEVRAALSVTAWLVQFLRNFDDGAPATPSFAPPSLGQNEDADESLATWSRQTSAESFKEHLGGGAPQEKSSAQKMWDGLEPMYMRFLHDAGVNYSNFAAMSATERVTVREKFDKVASAVLGRKNDSTKRAAKRVSLADATDEQVLLEMRQRLAAKATGASHEHNACLQASATSPSPMEPSPREPSPRGSPLPSASNTEAGDSEVSDCNLAFAPQPRVPERRAVEV
jgi:hypothetical protein